MPHARRITSILVAFCLLLPADRLSAQWRAPYAATFALDSAGETHTRGGYMALAGFGAGVAGLTAGVIVGNAVDRARGYDDACDCPRWGAAIGAATGMIGGMALGVHLSDRSRGRFLPVLERTALVNGAFWAVSYVSHRLGADADMVVLPLGMAAGIVAAIHEQRRQ